MRFAFTEDQLAFAGAARDLFAAACTPAAVRAAWESGTGVVEGLDAQLVEMGVTGVCAPESVGGLDLTMVELVAILHEAGRFAVPGPLAAVSAVAVPALVEAGLVDVAADLVAGRRVAAVGSGPDTLVAGAEQADVLLLESDGALHLVERSAATVTPEVTVDGARPVARVEWSGADAIVLDASADRALDRAAVATAAQLCGLADRMVEMTVEYVAERRQFGVPVGSFQAVKHRLADALIAAESAKPLVWRAAVALAEGDPESGLHSSAAKAAASQAALDVAGHALQCHGAIGYTVEHDLHLFMKRAWALAAAHGDARWHRRRVARLLGIGRRAG